MYDAIDVAEYVLWYCENGLNKPITNLQLQKFLYYIQGANLKINNSPLFDNQIMAWKYGPVVPDVYYWYNHSLSNPIRGVQVKRTFNPNEIEVINGITNLLINIDPWRIVELVHMEEPWVRNEAFAGEITIHEIQNWFLNNWEGIWSRFQRNR